MWQEEPFPRNALAYTSHLLSCEGQDAFWEYYSDTNRLVIYGRTYINQVYGLDVPYIEYDLNDYVTRFCDSVSKEVVINDIKMAIINRTGYSNIHHIFNPTQRTHRVVQTFGNTCVINNRAIICGLCHDITDVVDMEHSDILFAEAEKRVRILLDASPTACIFCDKQFKVIDCNKRAIALFLCYSKQDFFERFHGFFPEFQPDGTKSWEKKLYLLEKAMESGREVVDWWYQLSTGEAMPVELTLVRVPWKGGYCIANHIRDLRQLFAIRAQEREADERSLAMLNATPLACMLWDKEGQLLDCNQATVKLFEVPSKEAFLTRFSELSPEYQKDGLPSREKAVNLIKETYRQGGDRRFEWIHRTGSGESFPAEINMVRIKWKDDYYIAVYARDLRQFKAYIREIENIQEDLIAARNRAEKNAQAKSEFLANMSHEIRTPMNGILGMTNLMLHGDISEKQRFYVDTIDKSAKHLLCIINDILDFSKIDAGRMRFEQVEFSLQKVLGELIDAVMSSIEDKKLDMILIRDPHIPDTLIGDSFRLTQVLLNLFSNAVKFTHQGEICLTIDMDDPPDEQVVKLRFSVKDTGIGLTEEQIGRLFVPFSQADTSITRKYGGTGLGLAICKNLITLMGGSIWCESDLEKGTVFTFTLCFGRASPQKPPAYHHAEGKRVFALVDLSSYCSALRLYYQVLGCNLTISTEQEHWETELPPKADFIFISWFDIHFHIKDILEKISLRYGKDRPSLLIEVSSKEEQTFINSLDASCHVLYRPLTINALYRHIDGILMEKPPQEGLDSDVISGIPDRIRGAYVLLVEDNEINQLMASELLIMGGFKVDVAFNGREAVEMVARNPYDIVLMDIQMPEMDGLTATRIIRKSANHIPIIALTAHALAADREKSLEAGMNDHITKPIDHTLLFTAIARWVHPLESQGGYTA